jgi:hypothetical protein
MHTEQKSIKEHFIPDALRTFSLVFFTCMVLVTMVLVQLAAAASLGVSGLDSLAVSSSNEKRSNPPTAPNPGSWSSPNTTYFTGAYLPTIVAVVLGVWWKCIFTRLKEMEPFYQLTKPVGAEAKDSLLLSYVGSTIPKTLLQSLRSGHWLTFIGAINLVLLTLCTLFASSTLYLKGEGDDCGVIANATGDVNTECEIHLRMRPVWGFILGIFLVAVAAFTILVAVLLKRRSPRVFSEATSIAGIASLTTPKLSRSAQHYFQDSRCRYALVSSNIDRTNSITEIPPARSPYSNRISVEIPKRDRHWAMQPLSLFLFLLFEIAILILIVYYGFVSKPGTGDALEDFMNSESTGTRIFMACLGLGTKFYWGWIVQYIHRISPYVALAAPRGATAEESILLQSYSHPVIAIFSRGTWGHLLNGVVTLMASLSEVLVITLTAVPFTTATAYVAHKISVWLSITILGVMIITSSVVIFWQARNMKSELPEAPGCIADVLALIASEQGWSALGMLGDKERRSVVKGWGTRFGIQKVDDRWKIVLIPVRPSNDGA